VTAWLLGLDAGGGSGRALLLDAEGGAVVVARRAWTHPPAPGTGGLGVDLDLEGTWSALCEAAREAMARAGATPERVLGVAATGVRFASVVLDGEGRALLAASNRDGRAAGPALELGAAHGARLAARTGHWPTPISLLARLCWLARERPETARAAAHALALSDWLGWRMTGELASEPSQASTTGLFDVAAAAWADDLARELGLRPELLPALRPPGARLGALARPAARALGLRAGTPVAVGGADTQCGLLGVGALRPGAAGVIAGTSVPVQLVTAAPRFDPEARTWTECHVVPGCWLVESNAGPLGEALAWTAHALFAEAADPTARLLAEADRAEPGARGLLASLGSPVSDARALGVPIAGFAFSPLVAADDPERRRLLARAAVEGAAFALRANLEQARRVAGGEVDAVFAGGRLAASPTWLAALADALDRDLHVGATAESSALGAARLAGVGAGVWADADAAAAAAPAGVGASPDRERAARCARTYPVWERHAAARAAADAVAGELAMPEVLRARTPAASPAAAPRRPRMLVTADLDEASRAALARLGPVETASFREALRVLSGPALVEALAGFEVFVTEIDVVDAAALAKLPDLRVVAACRGDAVNVDVEACAAYGIPVLHAPGRNAEAVADLTLALVLMLLRRLPEAIGFLRQPGIAPGDLARMGQAFTALRGRELGARTVGLLGLGAVGRGVARRMRGFGARVLAHDPFVPPEAAALCDAEWVPFEELLARSDVVSLHAPVTEATRGLLGGAQLARMRPGAWLVNTARAALVDEEALREALASGHLGGAALDVFSVEPPGSDHPLLALPNVIATPHVGGNTLEVAGHQGRIVAADLARLLRGERPRTALDPSVLDGFDWSTPRPPPDRARLAARSRSAGPAVSDLQRDARPPERARTPEAARSGARAAEAGRAEAVEGDAVPAAPSGADAVATYRASPARDTRRSHAAVTMRRLLDDFVARCLGDAALADAADGRDVTLHFLVTDLDLAFWLRLRGGLSGGLGAPDAPAEVELRLRADVLDGMFTGRVNPMQAAMAGRLAFTGDAAKAMTLQHLQADLARLYRAAREAGGDPGDLAALPEPGGGAPGPTTPAAGADDLRVELCRVVGELYAQELVTATGGNVSARIPGRDELWITPSQLFKGDLRPEILVRIGLDGRPLDPGAHAPSSERLMHCAVYRARPEAMAVVHAHAPHATILANAGLPFLPISTEAAFFGELPRVPFIMPGTEALAKAVEEAARGSWAVLLVNHGLLVAGRSLRRAADMVEIVERSAQVILGCHAVGREPPVLPAEVVEELRRMGDLVA
jgi:autoinducer 2 (AI-2) kinase